MLEQIYIKNNGLSLDEHRTMKLCSQYSLWTAKAMFALYILCSTVFSFWPIGIYLWSAEIETPLAMRFPHIDISTRTGFTVMTAFEVSMLYAACIGLGFIDGLVAILTLNILVFSGLIRNQMTELNEMLLDPDQSKLGIHIKFRNIILMHKDMKE